MKCGRVLLGEQRHRASTYSGAHVHFRREDSPLHHRSSCSYQLVGGHGTKYHSPVEVSKFHSFFLHDPIDMGGFLATITSQDYDLCEECYLERLNSRRCPTGHVLVPLGTARDASTATNQRWHSHALCQHRTLQLRWMFELPSGRLAASINFSEQTKVADGIALLAAFAGVHNSQD